MKCIHCQHDCNYKDRSDKKCPSCRHAFAFEPREGDKVTDAGFQAAIDAVSSMGTVRFLPDHLYYEICRRKRSKGVARTILMSIGGLSLVGAFFAPVAALVTAAFFGTLGGALWPTPTVTITRDAFDVLWNRFVSAHGAPAALIVRRKREPMATPYRAQEMEHYSFDRAVVCDRPETVDLLLANNFHFENNCAVVSIDGYPDHAFETVRAMLNNNPRLAVYALHDATPEGCLLAHNLASDANWFRGRAQVIEVGIRPAHAKKHRGAWIRARHPHLAKSKHLTKPEQAWLASYALELASIRPEQVIKRLFAAVASDADRKSASEYVSTDVGGDYYVDGSSFDSDASTSDGGDDGFG